MAEQDPKAAKPSKPTERTVLLGVDMQLPQLRELVPESQHELLTPLAEEGVTVWVEVGEGTGGKAKAVDNVAGATEGKGDAEGEPQIEGRYRAPSTRSWEGGIELAEEVVPEARKAVRRHFA